MPILQVYKFFTNVIQGIVKNKETQIKSLFQNKLLIFNNKNILYIYNKRETLHNILSCSLSYFQNFVNLYNTTHFYDGDLSFIPCIRHKEIRKKQPVNTRQGGRHERI
jgi:hypothetical protein